MSRPQHQHGKAPGDRPWRAAGNRPLVHDDHIAGALLALVPVVGAAAAVEGLRHWFVIPVVLCGWLVLTDSLRWMRGDVDLFDPAGLIAVFGVHFFFAAPLLHVIWDEWMRYVEHPPDWRLGLGLMATLNFISLVAFRALAWREPASAGGQPVTWRINAGRWNVVFTAAVAASFAALAVLWSRFGGPLGVAQAYDRRLDEDAFTGMGWLFALAENCAPLMAIGLIGRRRRREIVGLGAVSSLLLVFLALRFLTAGMRGSRGNIIWVLFWIVGLIHLRLRPLSRKWLVGGAILLVAFLYAYGFFKYAGIRGFEALGAGETVTQDTVAVPPVRLVLLGDLGRADVQALLMIRYCCSETGLELAWGRTYAASLALLTPRSFWPGGRPQSKVLEGTKALQGWAPDEGPFTASNLYGLAGEALLNFGPLAIPLAYSLFGLLVFRIRVWRAEFGRDDPRELLFPFVLSVLLLIVVADSDVVLYYCVTTGGLVAAAAWLGSHRVWGADHQG